MELNSREPELADRFSRQYLDTLTRSLPKKHRTYGFEYEFLPESMLGMADMARLDRFLQKIGGDKIGGSHVFENGMRVMFEPGGQIEYCSPPLLPENVERFDFLLAFIKKVNAMIQDSLGINYLAVGYLPGRSNFPLCLRSARYLQLHKRLSKSGTRGHEMMKGTASIHLHVSISNLEELIPLFYFLCELSQSQSFRMLEERRNIWQHTDPTRCGLPPCCMEELDSPTQLINRLVRYALQAVVLGEQIPFEQSSDRSFSAFLYHMTTIFTDIRFNLKGPTLELRTLDSVSIDKFRVKWLEFIALTKVVG